MNSSVDNQDAKDTSYDVIVVGVGAVGSATCYQLAKRGIRVLGLERFAIPHAQGGSHGFSRQTTIAPYIGSEYEPIILRSYELWREIVEQSDMTVTTGFLDIQRDREFPDYQHNAGHFEELDRDSLSSNSILRSRDRHNKSKSRDERHQ